MERIKFNRLLAATKELAELELELRNERSEAEGEGKALVRRICGHMEKARAELEKAIGAAAIRQEGAQ